MRLDAPLATIEPLVTRAAELRVLTLEPGQTIDLRDVVVPQD